MLTNFLATPTECFPISYSLGLTFKSPLNLAPAVHPLQERTGWARKRLRKSQNEEVYCDSPYCVAILREAYCPE